MRTIVEVETDDGLVGLGEMGGGGESATAAFKALETYLLGHDPTRLEEMRFRIANPTASLYNNRTQLLAALEFACLDLMGPMQVSDTTRAGLLEFARKGGNLKFGANGDRAAEQRVAELLQLIVATREFQLV